MELARATRMLRCVLHSGVKVSYSGAIGQGRDGFNGYKVDWYCGGTLGHSRALWGRVPLIVALPLILTSLRIISS